MRAGPRGASAWRHSVLSSGRLLAAFCLEGSALVAGFPRAARLRSGEDFKRGLRARRRGSGRWFTASSVPNQGDRARLGIVVGRRVLPQATRRNRIKRITREHFRRLAAALGPVDVVIRLRNKLAAADMLAAELEVERLLREFAR